MNFRELLLLGLVGWTAIGVVGTAVSLARAGAAKALRGVAWIVGMWVVYLGVLIGVSLVQKQRVVAMGQEQCYDEMCFTVTGVDEVPGFLAHDEKAADASLRAGEQPRAQGGERRLIRAYLVDAEGGCGESRRGSPAFA